VCVCVCLDVNQGGTNHNHCTETCNLPYRDLLVLMNSDQQCYFSFVKKFRLVFTESSFEQKI